MPKITELHRLPGNIYSMQLPIDHSVIHLPEDIYSFEAEYLVMRYLMSAIIIVLILSLPSCVFAATIDNSTVQYYVNIYNSRIDNAPGILKSVVGNENIDISITRNDGSTYRTGLEMQNARISKTVEGGISNPTISINAMEDSINRIRSSSDPISTFQQEKEYGGIAIQGHTLAAQAKLNILSNPDVLRFLYNIFFG
jgi:hypothetical protein